MTSDSIAHERLKEIGAYICDQAEALVVEWERRSREEHSEAGREHREALRNHLPTFLREYGEHLARDADGIPSMHAVDHGIQRWSIGWDVESLVRDFMILRRVLIASLRSALSITVEEAMQIASSLDEAVALSVNAYVSRREAELNEKNELLRRSNDELKRFAHIVAHEIRNPLSAVQMAAARLDRYCEQSGEQRMRRALESINDGLVSITEVIKDLLEYAEVEAAHSEEEEAVDLNAVFEDALSSLQSSIRDSGADISCDDLPTVRGHRRGLIQLLQNLIENSIKYSGDRRPRVHISSETRNDDWLLIVRDNGIGIPEKHHESVFRFLARAHPDREIPGTGIGLAICKRVAEQHGGTIRIAETSDAGTTFQVVLSKQPASRDDVEVHVTRTAGGVEQRD